MIQTINQSQFIDAFRSMGRENQFSYGALCALFDWFEECEISTGEPGELDVISLCCEFSEYSNLEEFNEEYSNGDPENNLTMDEIWEKTVVIEIGNTESFLVQQY